MTLSIKHKNWKTRKDRKRICKDGIAFSSSNLKSHIDTSSVNYFKICYHLFLSFSNSVPFFFPPYNYNILFNYSFIFCLKFLKLFVLNISIPFSNFNLVLILLMIKWQIFFLPLSTKFSAFYNVFITLCVLIKKYIININIQMCANKQGKNV